MDRDLEIPHDNDSVRLERFELALRASHEGIWDWWIGQREIHYSRRILEFLECGDKRAPNLFLPPYDGIHPDEQHAFSSALSQALQNGGPEIFGVDARVRTGSNGWRWLRIRGTVVRNREGGACRIAGSMIDISRRKAAEAQVEEERFQLRQLIDHIPVQVYFKDLESRFVMANRGHYERMGVSDLAHLAGKHDRDFFSESHWKSADADERRIIESGQPMLDALEHETWPDREESWVVTSKFPWRDRKGRIRGTFGVSSDVTNLVTAQQQATDLAKQLQLKNQAYEEEVHLAREIQHALTSTGFPDISNSRSQLHFSSRYVPISGLAGDFFEVIQISNDRIGILISDVMGHGVRAALIVAMLRGLLEKQRFQAVDPGSFLGGLNEGLAAILERAETAMFATAFFGVIDLTTETFSYACAGHPGPIVDGPNGVAQIAVERQQKGPALGLINGSSYPTTTIPLGDIRRIVLFTDGILEAENHSGEPFFEQRLLELVSRNTSQPVEDLLDDMISSVLKFSQHRRFEDDVCLLAIDVTTMAR